MSVPNSPEPVKQNGIASTAIEIGEQVSQSTSTEEMSAYKKCALSVVTFKLVYEKEDLHSKDAITFKPGMAHQIFGESESIFGYRNVSITLNYLHNSSHCYVDVQQGEKLKNKNTEPDNILDKMNPWLPGNYVTKEKDFLAIIENEKHDVMFGEVVGSFQGSEQVSLLAGHNPPVYPTYKVTQTDIKDEDFKEFHSRFETFIVWFIDAANFIELEDERWLIYYVYEEFQHPKSKKIYRTPVGFCSIYKFFAYPNNIRARISQFLILPSHQKKGVGRNFYGIVAKAVRNMPEVVDITTEDPTPAFQKIRDLNECLTIHNELEARKINLLTASSKKMFELMKEQKICKKRCQRVYDILGCAYTKNKGLGDYRGFLNRIRERIKEETEREYRPGKRFCGIEKPLVPVDIEVQIETEYKKYLEEIEPSVAILKHLLVV